MTVSIASWTCVYVLADSTTLDLLNSVEQFLRDHSILVSLVVGVPAFVAIIWQWRKDRRDRRDDRREQVHLEIERRRLSERSLDVQASAHIYHRHDSPTPIAPGASKAKVGSPIEPFVVGRFDLANIGDGPVDVLACMVAGRELSDRKVSGLATQARDVAWDDLVPFFWNSGGIPGGESAPLFRGLSTTKNITYSPDQLIRLDHAQHEELIRIDSVTNFDELYSRGHVNLEYKIFTVALGYPLAVIHGMAGLSLDGPDKANELSRLYALDLARPNYRRWRHVERTLDIINRFTVRLALSGMSPEDQFKYGADDPLGRLSDALGWRCFLLHHWDFDDRGDAAPRGAPNPFDERLKAMVPIDMVKDYIRNTLKLYDPAEQKKPEYPARFAEACAFAHEKLAPLVEAWKMLNETIDLCMKSKGGFTTLITEDPDNRQRWEALQREGYLLTNLPRKFVGSDTDILAVERYAMRTKYALVTLKAPGHDRGRATRVRV